MYNSIVYVLYFYYPFGYLLCLDDMACETNIIITQEFFSTLGNASALPGPPFQMGDLKNYSLNISKMNFHFILILIFSTVSTIPTQQNFITLTSQKSKMSTQIWNRTSQVSLLRSFPKNSYLFIKQYPKIGIHTLKLFLELFLITTIPIMLFQSASLQTNRLFLIMLRFQKTKRLLPDFLLLNNT